MTRYELHIQCLSCRQGNHNECSSCKQGYVVKIICTCPVCGNKEAFTSSSSTHHENQS